MKKTILFMLVFFTLISCTNTVSATATSSLLSPALHVLAYNSTMVKSGLVTGSISFSQSDFENGIGCKVESITVTSLPDPSDGILTYNGSAVTVNQTISSNGLSTLRYVPTGDSKTASFRFKTSSEYSMECMLKYTNTINLAPSAAVSADAVSAWTQNDITTFGKLEGSDPDGDKICFEIVDYPEKGIINLSNASTGDYSYTPCADVTGKDKFTYVVVDEWGNYSEKCTVIVDIDEVSSDICFADMDGHWAHNAAIVMASENAMKTETVDGDIYFNPAEEISREEFLVSAMKILGAGEIEPADTVFADDSKISDEASGYVARAYSLGIIKGTEKDGLIYFEPASSVTRAEAAVILNSIIGAEEPDTLPAFADGETVPAWARGSLYALTSEGIFKGNGSGNISPNEPLSRAQTAQILLKVKQLYS